MLVRLFFLWLGLSITMVNNVDIWINIVKVLSRVIDIVVVGVIILFMEGNGVTPEPNPSTH